MFLYLRPIFINGCLPPLLENMFKFRNWKYKKKNKSEEKLSRPKFYQKKHIFL